MIVNTSSAEETQKIASEFAKQYQQGGILALSGFLGSGKTTFVQGLGKALGIGNRLISPTFILMREYSIPGNNQGKLFHIDLYRLENSSQAQELGLEDIFANPHNLVLIEWAEKMAELLPPQTVTIKFTNLGNNNRQIEILKPKI